jgi:hypothetical protein
MARVTQVTLELPKKLLFCDWAMGLMREGIYNTPHQERCVARMLGRNMSKMIPCAHKRWTVRVHRFCQIDWLHQHVLEVNHNDQVFADTTTSVTRIMFDCTLRFPSGSSPTTSYSNPGA